MSTMVLLLICFAAGVLARRLSGLPVDSYRVLNGWVLNVSLPALVLRSVHTVSLVPRLFLGAGVLWVEFIVIAGLALVAVRRGWATPQVAGAFALCAGLGNTAFVGLPLIESLGGLEAVPSAALIDQLGSFGVLSFVAVPFAVSLGGGHATLRAVLGRVVRFPPFIALVLALLLRPVAFPPALDLPLARLADMLSPLALASVGWQLDLSALRGQRRRMALGLVYKLGLAPAFAFVLLWALHGHFGLEERVTIAQAGMAPMVTAGVIAIDNGFEAPLASGMIALGVLASLATVPAWWALSGLLLG